MFYRSCAIGGRRRCGVSPPQAGIDGALNLSPARRD
jgi:hypothetical protein